MTDTAEPETNVEQLDVKRTILGLCQAIDQERMSVTDALIAAYWCGVCCERTGNVDESMARPAVQAMLKLWPPAPMPRDQYVRMAPIKLPCCGCEVSVATAPRGRSMFRPGDPMLCGQCEAVLIVTETYEMRPPTDEERAAWSPEFLARVVGEREGLRAFKARHVRKDRPTS